MLNEIKKKPEIIELKHNKKWYETNFQIRNENTNIFSYNKKKFSIPLNQFEKGLFIRRWQTGDKLISSTCNKQILISDLFINNKLSKYNKLTQPIIVNKMDRILWVPGLAHGKIEHGNNKSISKVIEWIQL